MIRGIARRAAIVVCAPQDRRWIEAMLAEAAEPAAGDDFASAGAIWSVAFASAGGRIDAIIAAPLRWAAIIAAHVAVFGLALSRTEIEFHGVDDDVCLRIATGAAALVMAIIAGAITAAIVRPSSRRRST